MKEKFKNMFEKVEDFIDDHGEHILEAAMFGFYAVITIGYGNSLRLQNKQKRLEIKALRKK